MSERQTLGPDFFFCEIIKIFEGMRHLCGLIAFLSILHAGISREKAVSDTA